MSHEAANEVDLRVQYRDLAVDWDAARDNPDEANRIFKAHHALYRRLRDTPAGRRAITGLLDDPVTPVRLLAATHSLQWEPDRAQLVLQEIEQEGNPYAVDAKWTLRSYHNGKLNLDW
jgi:Domain of unknown function (DUF2019)